MCAQLTAETIVSAQEPKKFALSSQRKLSVLLVVGIIILSAKECEMGPGGDGDKSFAYICTNGTIAEGTTGVENTEKCSACDADFGLNGANECVATFAYICTNGTAVDGTTIVENTEQCSACDTGFGLNGANECVDTTAPGVVTLSSQLPAGDIGNVELSWTEPSDADFSHVLISWTPHAPAEAIRVDRGTRKKVIARGLTASIEYIFTAKSVDTSGNESANSAGKAATPVFDCANPIFATTMGTTHSAQANVASIDAAGISVIPLVDGVDPACPIVIDFNHSAIAIAGAAEFFRITNMPNGATYTSSTFAWTYKGTAISGARIRFSLRNDGLTFHDPDVAANIQSSFIAKGTEPDMGMETIDDDFVATAARTFVLSLTNPTLTDSVTVTLTPTP